MLCTTSSPTPRPETSLTSWAVEKPGRLERAQILFELEDGVTGLHAGVVDLFASDRVVADLREHLGPLYQVTDWKETHKNLFSWMALEKYGMFLALSLIVAVAAFNIIATLIMVVMEKHELSAS